MFLEKCGQFFFSQIRPLFFFLLALFPVLAGLLLLFLETTQLQDLEERFAKAARKEKIAFERKARKERFLKRYAHSVPYFLDRQIESFALLEQEKEQLVSLLHHPAFPNHKSIHERLSFLENNRLTFTEEKLVSSSQMTEIEEKQRKAVQMDEADLQQILALIENVPVGPYFPSNESPQILIKDFRLKKIHTPLNTEVLEVKMDLIKREFNKS